MRLLAIILLFPLLIAFSYDGQQVYTVNGRMFPVSVNGILLTGGPNIEIFLSAGSVLGGTVTASGLIFGTTNTTSGSSMGGSVIVSTSGGTASSRVSAGSSMGGSVIVSSVNSTAVTVSSGMSTSYAMLSISAQRVASAVVSQGNAFGSSASASVSVINKSVTVSSGSTYGGSAQGGGTSTISTYGNSIVSSGFLIGSALQSGLQYDIDTALSSGFYEGGSVVAIGTTTSGVVNGNSIVSYGSAFGGSVVSATVGNASTTVTTGFTLGSLVTTSGLIFASTTVSSGSSLGSSASGTSAKLGNSTVSSGSTFNGTILATGNASVTVSSGFSLYYSMLSISAQKVADAVVTAQGSMFGASVNSVGNGHTVASAGDIFSGTALGAGTVISSAPSAPTLTLTATASGSITVSWGAVTGASSYNLYWLAGSTGPTAENGSDGATKVPSVTSPYTLSGLTAGSTYSLKVSAVGSGGESALSNVVTAAVAAKQLYVDQYSGGVTVDSGSGPIAITPNTFVSLAGRSSFTVTIKAPGGASGDPSANGAQGGNGGEIVATFGSLAGTYGIHSGNTGAGSGTGTAQQAVVSNDPLYAYVGATEGGASPSTATAGGGGNGDDDNGGGSNADNPIVPSGGTTGIAIGNNGNAEGDGGEGEGSGSGASGVYKNVSSVSYVNGGGMPPDTAGTIAIVLHY